MVGEVGSLFNEKVLHAYSSIDNDVINRQPRRKQVFGPMDTRVERIRDVILLDQVSPQRTQPLDDDGVGIEVKVTGQDKRDVPMPPEPQVQLFRLILFIDGVIGSRSPSQVCIDDHKLFA